MITTYHLCLDIAGYLKNHPDLDDYENMLSDENGDVLSADEAKAYLQCALESGKRVIMASPDCNNFDFQTGCKGHLEASHENR